MLRIAAVLSLIAIVAWALSSEGDSGQAYERGYTHGWNDLCAEVQDQTPDAYEAVKARDLC